MKLRVRMLTLTDYHVAINQLPIQGTIYRPALWSTLSITPASFASVAFGDSDSPSFGGMTGASWGAGVDFLGGGDGGESEERGADAG